MNSRWFDQPFCRVFPIAHLMRVEFPKSWLRIHSLPESKRYPENDIERHIVFERYSSFGTELLGENARCMIIRSRLNGFQSREAFIPEIEWTPIHQVIEDEAYHWDCFRGYITWNSQALRKLLLAIAEDEEEHIAFLSETTDNVFIPYDGGADGFSFDSALLQKLSEQFASWRSLHPLGL